MLEAKISECQMPSMELDKKNKYVENVYVTKSLSPH